MANLGDKNSFGDVALTALNPKLATRGATIVAATYVECIILMRKEFLLVKNIFSREAKDKGKSISPVFPFILTLQP